MRQSIATIIGCSVVAGCSGSENVTSATPENPYGLAASLESQPYGLQQALASDPPAEQTYAPEAPAAPAVGPQIAYSYAIGYRLEDGAIRSVQTGHVTQCNALGRARCRIVSTRLSSGDDPSGYVTGQAVFLIDARQAKAFITKLDGMTGTAGGTVIDREVEAEDITKQVIDNDAKVRAKQALADRLLALIRNTNAKVGDLVAAERAYSETQEVLDAARSLQAELRQRVAMSRVTLSYNSSATTGRWAKVAQSLHSAGSKLAGSVAALVTFLVAALPWAALLALLVWLGRRRGWRVRWPWRRKVAAATD